MQNDLIMEKQVTNKSTKTEILDAYEDLLKKMQDKKVENPKVVQEERLQKETIKTASLLSYESIVKGITELKMNLSASLDKLEDMLVEKYKHLSQLNEAIKLQEQYVDDLYGIKVGADTLAALTIAQKEKKENFERDMEVRKEQLDDEILEKKQNWQKEQQVFEQNKKEQTEQLKNERKREEEEFRYNLNLTRKKDGDAYEEKKLKLEKELEEKRIAFDKDFAGREQKIIESETELNALRDKAAKFPGELNDAIQKAENAIAERMQTQYEYEKQLTAEKTNGEQRLKDQVIISLKEKIKEQELLIKQLTDKATGAENSVKDIAIKALETSVPRIVKNDLQDRQEK